MYQFDCLRLKTLLILSNLKGAGNATLATNRKQTAGEDVIRTRYTYNIMGTGNIRLNTSDTILRFKCPYYIIFFLVEYYIIF